MAREPASLPELVAASAARKLRARHAGTPSAWLGLGMFGIIGWSVSVPTVLGALLGAWIDRHAAGGRSWTLALLVAGLLIGCGTAGHWVAAQNAGIGSDTDADDE
jgi:ATP synthase protein I